MLHPVPIPGLFVTGTDTGVGKTAIAGAIAQWFARRGLRAGVCKPVATGCRREREQLFSPDAEFLASCADSPFPLDVICPARYAEPLAPAIAARRARRPIDWAVVDAAVQEIARQSDVLIVEGIGGILVPLDERFTVLHMASWLRMPAVVVARPSLGTINHTLLTLTALRWANVPIAGVVINRYPAESAGAAEETAADEIERIGQTNVLCLTPDEPLRGPTIPVEIADAVDRVDWGRFAVPPGGIQRKG